MWTLYPLAACTVCRRGAADAYGSGDGAVDVGAGGADGEGAPGGGDGGDLEGVDGGGGGQDSARAHWADDGQNLFGNVQYRLYPNT